ncbi:HNH endonuclease signature motif containing protein [Dermacoccus barathri]|uniref:HNH endonuclease signature motif containing protein n=1 Tax=Dermacoccus barathri TaxID=322601 RepID=UPI0029D413C8|nr:HNH endonuclease signature motif containing protein [Dermacoccus barathri]
MAGWIITISKDTPEHWQFAQESGFWDFTRKPAIEPGDYLYFWQSAIPKIEPGHFVGVAQAISGTYDRGDREMPWVIDDERRDRYTSRVDLTTVASRVESELTAQALADSGFVPQSPTGAPVMNSGPFHVTDLADQLEARVLGDDFPHTDFVMADNDVHLDYGGDQEPIDMSDARKRVERTVVARQGQPRFRNELLRTYGNRCAVTRCSTAVLLDAAHLLPYRGPQTNRTDNGILLRTDLHTLFDSHLMTFMYRNEDQLVALFSPGVDASYRSWHGSRVHLPPDNSCRPHPDALEQHRQACPWLQNGWKI